MNVLKKIYCRSFQAALKIALPLLPYRDPQIIDNIGLVPAALAGNGLKKPMIVTDQTIRGLGLTKKIEDALKESGFAYCIFDKVVANPTTENVAEALDLYRENGCDSLIAFGGGSPMDCAKGVGARIAKPKKSLNDLKGILKVRKRIPCLIAIPTTAGTGSETTLACVVVDGETRHKYAINDFPLIPAYAVLDEDVTMSLPKNVVSTTGMDALTHAIEAFIGKGGNRSTRKDALEACSLIFENIEKSYFEGTREARKNMLVASHKAGRAFSKAYVGYVHALAHALGGKYDTPHGLANAVILPVVLKEYSASAQKKLAVIARYCGLTDKNITDAQAAEKVIAKIEELNQKMGIPARFDFIKDEDVREMADYAYREANPLYPVPELWDRKKLAAVYGIIGEYNDAE